jgi:hypothetical protein
MQDKSEEMNAVLLALYTLSCSQRVAAATAGMHPARLKAISWYRKDVFARQMVKESSRKQ